MEILIAIILLFWGFSLICICSRRDIDVHDKITWVVVILVLNVLGSLVYFALGPKRKLPDDHPDVILSKLKSNKPIAPKGCESWNPIIGYNSNEAGTGLNAPDLEIKKDNIDPNTSANS